MEVGGSLLATRSSPALAMLATFGSKVLGAGLGLGNVLLVARVLGPDGRGSVAFVFATAILVAQVASLGAHWAIPNLGAGDRGALRALAGNSVVLSVLLGGGALAALAVAVDVVPAIGGHVDAGTRWIGLASVPLLILSYCLLTLAQSEYRFSLMNLSMLLVPALTLAANATLAAEGALSVRSVVAAWVIGQAASLGFLVFCVSRHVGGFGRPNARLARDMLGFGAKANAGQMAMAGTYRLDQWLLGSISGSRPLGLYSVAVAWAEVLFFLPEAVATVQRPDLVRASGKEASSRAAKGFRAATLLTLLSAAVAVAAAPFLCTTIFGDAFQGSVRDLRVLALGAFGVVAIKQLGVALTAQGKPLLETAAILVAFVATAAADVLLIPSHADFGASIASSLSYSAGGLAMAIVFLRVLGARPSELIPGGAELVWIRTQARALASRLAATG